MNRERWLLVASVLMVIGVVIYHLRPGGSIRPARPAATSPRTPLAPVTPETRPQGASRLAEKAEAVAEQAPWGRNPFLTEREAAEIGGSKPDEIRQVKAIIVGQSRNVATVDGHTVVVGDKLGEETVWEIRPDAVVLEKDGRKRVLRIAEPSVGIDIKEGKP